MRAGELMMQSGMDMTGRTLPIDPEIRGLSADSRSVEPGFLFAALPGSRADGRAFIGDAVARGAVAVLAPEDSADRIPAGTLAILDTNPRRRLSLMAAAFHGPQPAHVAAVTGTNGKTSVASFARQIWARLGYPAASLGTLGIEASHFCETLSLTTPDPVALIREIARLADRGISHLAFEASSHGLDQFRVDGVRVTSAAFTNLSRDHLDYHGTMDAYLSAKARLFTEVMAAGGTAILNADVPEFGRLRDLCAPRHRVIAYGRNGDGLRLLDTDLHATGQDIAIEVDGRRHRVGLGLVGAFQAWNVMAALGLVVAEGGDPEQALAALPALEGVRGRLQRVAEHPSGAGIFVDYAHTPDALETVLNALRPHTERRLVCVFGCGGDRDRGKRPVMGGIAGRLADRAIVTDDNPRTEDPAAIRAEIMAGCPGCEEIGDRATAIYEAARGLESGDILLIAGKGHEQGQIIGDRVIPFDDAAVAGDAIAALERRP